MIYPAASFCFDERRCRSRWREEIGKIHSRLKWSDHNPKDFVFGEIGLTNNLSRFRKALPDFRRNNKETYDAQSTPFLLKPSYRANLSFTEPDIDNTMMAGTCSVLRIEMIPDHLREPRSCVGAARMPLARKKRMLFHGTMINLEQISKTHLETEPYQWVMIDGLFTDRDAAALADTIEAANKLQFLQSVPWPIDPES